MNTQEEKELIKEEKQLAAEVKKEGKQIKKLIKDVRILAAALVLVVLAAAGGVLYLVRAGNVINIDNSSIAAPAIDLASSVGGELQAVNVNEGDAIAADTVVARVGNELVKSNIAGIVIMARQDIGKIVAPGEKIVTMIDPADLRVVGRLEEDKGLKKVSVGQRAAFTADAFGSRQFAGVVDEVSPTSRAGDVVFSISDKRQEQQFDVKVRFDVSRYPELKNGMSAKLKIYRN